MTLFRSPPRLSLGALIAAILVVAAPLNEARAAAAVAKPPLAAAQNQRPGAFFEAQRKEIQNANSVVGDDFIARWFGPETLKETKSPMLEGADDNGPYSIEFVKEGAAWKKVKAPLGAPAPGSSAGSAQSASNSPSPAGFSRASQSARLAPGVLIQPPKVAGAQAR